MKAGKAARHGAVGRARRTKETPGRGRVWRHLGSMSAPQQKEKSGDVTYSALAVFPLGLATEVGKTLGDVHALCMADDSQRTHSSRRWMALVVLAAKSPLFDKMGKGALDCD